MSSGNHIVKYFCYLILAWLFGCTEVINLKNDSTGDDLVIFGRITNGGIGNIVTITRTEPEGQDPSPVSGAVVTVIDQNGLEEQYVEAEPGTYELCRTIVQGQVGGRYQLRVELDGETYTSGSQEMMPILGQDELHFEVGFEERQSASGSAFTVEGVRLFANTTFNELPEEFYIRWAMEETYTVFGVDLPVFRFPNYSPLQCYIYNEISEQDIFLVDGTSIRNFELNNREVGFRPLDHSFSAKHYFGIIQMAQNKEAHEYWQKLSTITTRQGSIFDQPPAAIPGNITSSDSQEKVFGFFEAVSADTSRLLMTNNDIPRFFLDPCQFTQEQWVQVLSVPIDCVGCLIEQDIVDAECIICTLLENSTLIRPSYF